MVVAAAGNVEHRQVLRLVAQAFGNVLGAPAEPDPPRVGVVHGLGGPARSLGVLHRSTEQAHVVLGSAGLDRFDERRYALGVLNNALGGGMSSRLFQEVRERRGLAYSVYSFASQYAGGGSFGVYAGCQPSRTHEVLSIVRDELAAVAAEGITEEEVERGKGQFRGGLVLGLEDTGSRMSRIGKHELTHGEHVTVPELLARIEAVTVDEVRQLAGDLLNRPMCLAVVGPFAEDEFDGEL